MSFYDDEIKMQKADVKYCQDSIKKMQIEIDLLEMLINGCTDEKYFLSMCEGTLNAKHRIIEETKVKLEEEKAELKRYQELNKN